MASRAGQAVVKQGSLGRAWLIVLDEPDPADAQGVRRRPIDLTLLTGAVLRYRKGGPPGLAPTRGGACAVQAPATGGVLTFQPGPEDVDTVGEFAGVLVLTWAPAAGVPSPEIIPNRGYLPIVVEPAIPA